MALLLSKWLIKIARYISRDNEFAAIGDDNQSGLSWQAKSGEYYVGIGTFSEVEDLN